MENVEAKSRDIMPAVFQFTRTPYDELSERAIKPRYSVLTGGDVPVLVPAYCSAGKLEEQIAQEFRDSAGWINLKKLKSRRISVNSKHNYFMPF